MSKILVNGLPVMLSGFPGGEVKVELPTALDHTGDVVSVTASLYSSADIMALVMVTNAVRHYCKSAKFGMVLRLPYFPYARQDRVCNIGESHGVQAMAGLINSLGYTKVYVYDPHSDAVQAAVHNCEVIKQSTLAKAVVSPLLRSPYSYELVSPDAGAEKKVLELSKQLSAWGQSPSIHYAHKVRNPLNGQILSTTFEGNVEGKNLIIVDDICDGGRTFTALAGLLRARGAARVDLYVTHGIFSAGIDALRAKKGVTDYLDHVYCVHSFTEKASDFLTIVGI